MLSSFSRFLIFVVILFDVALAKGQVCEESFVSLVSEVTIEVMSELLPPMLNGEAANFRARRTTIGYAGHTFDLHQLARSSSSQISASANVSLFHINHKGERTKIELPGPMRRRVAEYLRNGGPPSVPFDCNCFVHYLAGVPYTFGKFDSRSWDISLIAETNPLKPGDAILIGYGPSEINHVAISLGQGLYLSKFGQSGPLLVTDLSVLELAYGGIGLLVARPKN